MPAILVLVTCKTSQAETIAQTLVEEKLAGCVSIGPEVRSIYRWQGELCRELESLLLIKTQGSLWTKLEERIKELHSYSVPEILALPIDNGHEPYLKWLLEQTNIKMHDSLPKAGSTS